MRTLHPVEYSPVAYIEAGKSDEFLQRLIASELPGFVVRNAGKNLLEAVECTGLVARLTTHGFEGSLKQTTEFEYGAKNILPFPLTAQNAPGDTEWYDFGVTPFHRDVPHIGGTISLNHTKAGSVLYRLHAGRTEYDAIGQWDELGPQVRSVLLDGVVDTQLLDPAGHIATVEARDLFVFDAGYVHSGQTTSVPRASQAVFYDRTIA